MTFDDLSDDEIYACMLERDQVLDGIIFVGVLTTGIYCRPVCRARIPRKENVSFYKSAAAAEAAGFRPCLRCRPETAPFCPAWQGTRTTVSRALALIEDGALDRGSVASLAARLGIGERHLSRLFARHLEATPTQVARTRRVQRAKLLLETSAIPVKSVAETSGFGSAKRMHSAFVSLYGKPPSKFRSNKQR